LSHNLQIARETNNRWGIGLALEQLAGIAQSQGDHAAARRMLEEGVALNREVGDPWSLSRSLNALSRLALLQADPFKAEEFAIQAVRTAAEVEHNTNAYDAIATLAETHVSQGRNGSALMLALFVLENAVGPQDAKERAQSIRTKVETLLTPKLIASTQSHVQSMTLDRLLQEFVK
jgi:hypothetical protein